MTQEPWLTIWKVNRGYLVKCGCQYLIFRRNEHGEMKEAFVDLLENENKAAKKWCDLYDKVPIP